jgi:hypothetical protein
MPNLLVYDQAQFTRIVASQLGAITRSQALVCGLTRSAISHRLRTGGPWQQMLPGVYLTMTGTPNGTQRAMAALLYSDPRSMITGPFAIQWHGLDGDEPVTIDVLVPADCQRKSTSFVRIQRTRRLPETHLEVGPLRMAPAVRAVADTAQGMSRFSDVQSLVCQAVQRNRCTPEELAREVDAGPMRGSRLFREAVSEVASGIWSSPEGDLKRLIDRSGLEKPVYNAKLYAKDGTFLGCPDAWWPRAGVAAEVDSRQYHVKAQDYDETVAKHTRMTVAGIQVLHWLPKTIRKEGGTVVADLRDAIRNGKGRPKLPIIITRNRASSK